MANQDFIRFMIDVPFENLYLIMALGMLRTFGLLFGFLAFGWAFGSMVSLRVAVAFVLSLPVMFATLEQTSALAELGNALELALVASKEFGIGFGLGILASSPFRALQHAGAISDAFRGESESGITSPDGSPIQTFSVLYIIIGFYVFISLGGLWHLHETLLKTYTIWPLNAYFPSFFAGAGEIVLTALNEGLKLALVIAAPLMILLFGVELVLMVAAKLGRRFGMYNLSFLAKNFLTVLTMPLIVVIIVKVAETYTPGALLAISTLENLFN